MHYFTFLISGIEVLHLGAQYDQSNAWPIAHWRQHSERLRIFTPAIDAYLQERLADRTYGGNVEGFVLMLEIADFAAWPGGSFSRDDRPPSFKRGRRDIACAAQLAWPEVGKLSLKKQFDAYVTAAMAAVDRVASAKRMPKGFLAMEFKRDLAEALALAKPSQLTRSNYRKRLAATRSLGAEHESRPGPSASP